MTSAYTEEKLEFRQQVLLILFKNFATGDYSNQSIYECVHDWVSQGNMRTDGLVKYYQAYYTDK